MGVFSRLLNEAEKIEETETWLDKTKGLGKEYYFPITFLAYTGLRPSEACLSLSILVSKGKEGYYNSEIRALEHYRFPAFCRGTKNAYLSFVSEGALEAYVAYGKTISYDKLRCKIRREGLPVMLQDLRKAWATRLREGGISQESIDLLHRRISKNIFTRFYYRPSLKELGERVLSILKPLEGRLLEATR